MARAAVVQAHIPMPDLDYVAPGISWGQIYWVRGELPTKDRSKVVEVTDPPTSGWSMAFLIDRGVGRLVTLFAPATLEAFQVTRASYEVQGMLPSRDGFDRDATLGVIYRAWETASRNGWAKDYDVAASLLRELEAPVPLHTAAPVVDQKPSGGKEADVLGLTKPVKRRSRRGDILAFFLGGPRSVREAMAEFGITRSNCLSQLYIIQKDHGIGYALTGDAATITLPAGCTDPFGGSGDAVTEPDEGADLEAAADAALD